MKDKSLEQGHHFRGTNITPRIEKDRRYLRELWMQIFQHKDMGLQGGFIEPIFAEAPLPCLKREVGTQNTETMDRLFRACHVVET